MYGKSFQTQVESAGGNLTPHAHRTVREPLDSYGSCYFQPSISKLASEPIARDFENITLLTTAFIALYDVSGV
jgi:hypothetical protein